jgi:5-methylcytosine-specific restriction endonuclease McrA
MSKTIRDLILEYFQERPNQALEHGQVVDWVTREYLKTHPTPPRDTWRGIRSLAQEGMLIKVRKGVYMYDPDLLTNRELEDFTNEQKAQIFKRDGYRCVRCGRGRADGVEIHADHIIAKDSGGKATIENGQTLCAQHNFQKKNYNQTESGKRMFIRLYELAKKQGDEKTMRFCVDILETFERHGVNGHIEWQSS